MRLRPQLFMKVPYSKKIAYIYPEDWPAVDQLVDWLIPKNKAGYQMVKSVKNTNGDSNQPRPNPHYFLLRESTHPDQPFQWCAPLLEVLAQSGCPPYIRWSFSRSLNVV